MARPAGRRCGAAELAGGPVRWGVLGAGLISRVALAPAFRASPDCQVVAVAARDGSRAAALVPGARAYSSYAELLADPAVEAVYIALANDAHVPWSVESLRAGKHVLCEKPLGLDAAEVEAAQTAASAAGLLLVEASWYRWHPRTRRAEAMIAGGELGPVTAVDAGFTFEGVDSGNYRMVPGKGGGSLYDVGCYACSAVGWATGWRLPRVTSVAGRMGVTGVDMMVDARLEVPGPTGPVAARVRAAFDEPESQWIEVAGREARIRFGPPAFTAWTGHATTLEVGQDGGEPHTVTFAPCDPYRLMVEAMSGVIRGGDDWVVPPEETLATARALDAIRAATAGRAAPGGS